MIRSNRTRRDRDRSFIETTGTPEVPEILNRQRKNPEKPGMVGMIGAKRLVCHRHSPFQEVAGSKDGSFKFKLSPEEHQRHRGVRMPSAPSLLEGERAFQVSARHGELAPPLTDKATDGQCSCRGCIAIEEALGGCHCAIAGRKRVVVPRDLQQSPGEVPEIRGSRGISLCRSAVPDCAGLFQLDGSARVVARLKQHGAEMTERRRQRTPILW